MNPRIVALVKDRGLIAVVVLVVSGIGIIVRYGRNLDDSHVFILLVTLLIAALGALWIHNRWRFAGKTAALDERVRKLTSQVESAERRANNPAVSIITKHDYRQILLDWSKAEDEGQVLLYNIELQSFENQAVIQDTWGGLRELTRVKEVALLLPTAKVRRWEHIVIQQEHAFFQDPANRKFSVCEFVPSERVGEGPAPSGIAFAIYRFVSGARSGQLHSKAVWFILSRPFSQLHEPMVEGDAKWWDYRDILSINGRDDIRTSAIAIWNAHHNPTQARDVDRVLLDKKPLMAVEPKVFFDNMGFSEEQVENRMRQFHPRKVDERSPLAIPLGGNHSAFNIRYDNHDTIHGHFEGVTPHTGQLKPGLIWAGGFTEAAHSRLPELFARVLRKEDVVQFYYEVSPPVADVTLSRYAEDMREVLRYVNAQGHVVMPNGLVLVARSINGLVAALVAAEEEFRSMLAGLILVAPVFDVVEMMDNYRSLRGQPHVRVEKCWRRSPGFDNGIVWETARDPNQLNSGWLEFFTHDVRMTLLADIVRHAPDKFSREAFKRAVGRFSEQRPVVVLSDPNDPITGSEKALEALSAAATGTGRIRRENYCYQPIHSGHLLPEQIDRDRYPFLLREEARSVRDALRSVLKRLSIPAIEE